MARLRGKCLRNVSYFYCPAYFHHIDGIDVCLECDICPELCGVKRGVVR
jgi:hypothetical protein